MTPLTLTFVTFAATVLACVGVGTLIYDLVVRDRVAFQSRLVRQLSDQGSDRAMNSPLFRDLQQLAADSALPNPTWTRRAQIFLEQSGTGWQLIHVAVMSGVCGVVVLLLLGVLTRQAWLTCGAAAVSVCLPSLYVRYRRDRRIRALCVQLPEAFDFMARALRAGQTLQTSFQMVAQSFRAPLGEEFSHCHEQQHLGITHEIALRDLARRVGIMELQIFAVALIVQRRTGGNLAELLGKLAILIRKRGRLHERVKALTGEGRLQALVLIALPPLVFLAIHILNRTYAQVLLDHPRLIYGALASQAVGTLWIRRIINIDF